MTKLPIYFGYAGAVPFVAFMLAAFFIDDLNGMKALSFVQLSYGAMILSFLGGVHWGQAIPTNNKQQLSFAMVPTVACFGLMIWAVVFNPVLPLFGMVLLFWVVYFADRKMMPLDYIPEGYFTYRRNLTIIVSATLFLSAAIMVF